MCNMAANRQERLSRLKRMIILIILVMILLPTFLCVYLVIKMNRLEQEIQKIYQTKIEVIESKKEIVSREPERKSEKVESVKFETVPVKKEPELSLKAEEETDDRKKVYLTFDDGPSCYTEEILDILDQYGVKATFFVVGKEERNIRPLYAEIAARGHTLGMHSYSHRYSEIYESVESFEEDLHRISDLIYEETGESPLYYRFPGGSSNQVSRLDMQEYITCLEKEKITYFDWNVEGSDAGGSILSAEQILDNVKKDSNRYDTSIVLLHDTGQKRTTVEALPEIIEYYQDLGVALIPIDQSTELIQHR